MKYAILISMKMTKILIISIATAVICFSSISCAKPGDRYVTEAGEVFYLRRYDRAIQLLDQALNDEGGTTYSKEYIYVMKSKAYLAQLDYSGAAESLEKAMEIQPEYMELNSLAMCYLSLSEPDFAKAEATYNRAIELSPESGEAYAGLGALYLKENKYNSAVENLKKASSFLPNHNIVYGNLALAYAYTGDFDSAMTALTRAEELSCPDIESFKLRIAELSEKQ